MKIRPLHDRVLVKRLEGEEKTKGGLFIPDTAKEKPIEGTVLAVGNGTVGEFVRFISLEVQNVNGAMFIKAARARGAGLWRHFFKSMVLPLFNIVVTNMAVLLGGLVVVERIFNFHGLGWLSWEATLKRDFSVIMGITLVMAFLIRVFMLVNDLLAIWLDPRLRD